MREAWHQHYLDAVLAWAEIELRLGNPGAVIGSLSELADRYPLCESVLAMLIRALAAAGRQAEALDQYQRMRQRLVAELGVDPGAELREIYHGLLRGAR
jgi:DNA-binding SARP family transcriptional activator